MSGIYLITTRVKPKVCRCRAAVLNGVVEGLEATVDMDPTDPAVEYLALLDGRRTFNLSPNGTLIERDASRISGSTFLRLMPIHAQHICAKEPEQLALDLEAS